MPDILIFVFILYWIFSRIKSVRNELQEKIESLESTVQILNERVGSLRRQIKNLSESVSDQPSVEDGAYKPLSEKETHQKAAEKPFEKKVDKPTEKTKEKPADKAAKDFSALSFSQKPSVTTVADSSDQKEKKSYDWLNDVRSENKGSGAAGKPAASEKSSEVNSDKKTEGPAHDSVSLPPLEPPPPGVIDRWRDFFRNVDWEIFAGANLFAWLGGLALFIGAGFFVKYSIDKNLISPVMRLVIGALVGLAMIGGSFWFEKIKFAIMRQTFAAGGIGVLYSVFFAATLYYEYLARPAGFAALVVVSIAAFVLALFHKGVAIAVLGGTGAYLTPLLVSTGSGNLVGLFAYLAIVNFGVFEVLKRLDARSLILFASAGTAFSLFCGTFLSSVAASSSDIAIAWIGNLFVMSLLMERNGLGPFQSRAVKWAACVNFGFMLFVAMIHVVFRSGSSPMVMMAGSAIAALTISWRNTDWQRYFFKFVSITFVIATLWTFRHFNNSSTIWAFAAFFVYGLAGGIGPVLLIKRNGLDSESIRWFKVFPLAMSFLLLMTIIVSPNISQVFWPMAIGLQLVGIFVSMIFAGFLQVLGVSALLLFAAIYWLGHMSAPFSIAGFYGLILAAAAAVLLVVFWVIKRADSFLRDLPGAQLNTAAPGENSQIEIVAAIPITAVFILLATAFAMIEPLNPSPGMMTLLCSGAISLTLARRLKYPVMIAVTLFSAVFAQAFWAFRPDLSFSLYFESMAWAGSFFIAAIALPFIVYRDFKVFRIAWMAWPVFELVQALFFIFAADYFWGRNIAGWIPFIFAFVRLPVVARLLKKLDGLEERNSIIACQGGVLLFYLSLAPILLLEKGWLGLVLVFEAVALLWLNRRIAHEGLRKIAAIMAPAGLYLLVSFLGGMKGPQSLIILNPAVMSVLAATIGLFFAVRLAPYPEEKLWSINLGQYFQWLAVGTGFYLVNLVVADVFAGSLVQTGPTIKFAPAGNLLHSIAYVSLWAIFGAVLWRCQDLPTDIRWAGMILLVCSFLWLLMFPFFHGHAVAKMAPLVNLGLLAYLPVFLVLVFLFLKEPWGETSVSIKNLFLAMLLVTGILALKIIKSTIFQAGQPFDIFMDKTANMAVASAVGWMIYGVLLLVWPRRLDRPFRVAGLILLGLGIGRALLFPFRYAVEFGSMEPLLNRPTAMYLFCIGLLVWLTRRRYDDKWPVSFVAPQVLFATTLAVIIFAALNIEIASYFGQTGRPFSLLTRGSLAHELGYSLGWLVYAIGLLAAGIFWKQVKARQAALILVLITCFKIFLKDLWSLGQLYRVASFIGLAIVLMLVSYLYQRFLANPGVKTNENN